MSRTPNASVMDRLSAGLVWLLPTRVISRSAHTLAHARLRWLKRLLINSFLRAYPAVNMREAAEPDPHAYPSFNAFFTRALATDARPLPDARDLIVSPVDGCLGAFGQARSGVICQAKGMAYDVRTLVGRDDAWAAAFLGGHFATFYLAPHDYHRVHMPLDGCVRETRYLPGRLFGVSPHSVRAIPRLFARNERLVTFFDTAVGPLALVMVGAFIVGGIHTRWGGQVCPPHRSAIRAQGFDDADSRDMYFQRGAEMGRFSMGSSVILLFGPGALAWTPGLTNGEPLLLGQSIARLGSGA